MAHSLELGGSSDLDVAYFLKDDIHRVDLHAVDRERPRELLDFLEALLARITPPSRRSALVPGP